MAQDKKWTQQNPLRVDLALQGGGAHGAFTWGVLDRLLEESWLKIEGISGTSAGAMNAAVMAHGFTRRRRGWRVAGTGNVLAQSIGCGPLQSFPARPARCPAGPLDARPFARFRGHGHDGARVLALRSQSWRHQSAPRHSGGDDRFRAAGRLPDQTVRDRNECPYRPRPRVPQRRVEPGCAACVRLPADAVSSDRD